MNTTGDMELLREYAEGGSEAAFETLVRRHVHLVHSAAFRQVRNPALAAEVTQTVFIILARKARGLRRGTILSGWLYRTAQFAGARAVRDGIRRQNREKEAAHMQAEPADPSWEQISPLLEEAMTRLGDTDRNAVVLRFFENKSLRDVGAALGVNEGSAQKRVARAVEKLRGIFAKRGVALSAGMVTATLSANAVQAAPAAVATAAATAATVKTAAVKTSTAALIDGTLKLMAWANFKAAMLMVLCLLLAGGTTALAVKEIGRRRAAVYSWQVPQASFQVLYQTPPQVVIVPTRFSTNGGYVGDHDRVLGIAQPVRNVILSAYGRKPYRTLFTTELPRESYDYIANLPTGSGEALREEIRNKFGLTGKMDVRETAVLRLQLRNPSAPAFGPGTRMPPAKDPRLVIPVIAGKGKFTGYNQPMSTLDSYLENYFEAPIVDETGLTNRYDWKLTWDEPGRKQDNPEGLKRALVEEPGLELVPGRATMEMLVVEKAAK